MENETRLSVVLPSYLEEENLRVLLPRLYQTLDRLNEIYEIIVVDTVTPLDNTKNVCDHPSTKYVNRKMGNTFGDAIRTGIKESKGEYVLFMDADGSHTPEFIPNLYKYMTQNDIVIASRYISGGFTENNTFLVWMSRILNCTYSFVLNVKCKDISNSFRIYRASVLKKINLYCDNFDIVEEILLKAYRQNKKLKVKEVPFTFKKRMFGKTKRNLFFFILTYLYTLLKLRFTK